MLLYTAYIIEHQIARTHILKSKSSNTRTRHLRTTFSKRLILQYLLRLFSKVNVGYSSQQIYFIDTILPSSWNQSAPPRAAALKVVVLYNIIYSSVFNAIVHKKKQYNGSSLALFPSLSSLYVAYVAMVFAAWWQRPCLALRCIFWYMVYCLRPQG